MKHFVIEVNELCEDYDLDKPQFFQGIYKILVKFNKNLSNEFCEEAKNLLICAKCGVYLEDSVDQIIHNEITPPMSETIVEWYCPKCGERF